MGIFNRFPYTDFHRLNADWILEKVKEMLGLTQQAAEDAQTASETAEQAAGQVQNFSERMYFDQVVRPLIYVGQETFPTNSEEAFTIGRGDDEDFISIDDVFAAGGYVNAFSLEGICVDSTTGYIGRVEYINRYLMVWGTGLKIGAFDNWATKTYVANNYLPKTNPNVSGSLSMTGRLTTNQIKLVGNDNGIVFMDLADHEDDHAIDFSATWPEGEAHEPPILRGVRTPSLDTDAANKAYVDEQQVKRYNITGTTPTIAAVDGAMYIAEEVDTLTVTSVPATGLVTIVFVSGSTPASLVLPNTVIMPDTFDEIEADTRYEISILDRYGTVKTWGVE